MEHLPAVLALALQSATMTSQGSARAQQTRRRGLARRHHLAPRDAPTAREQFLAHRQDLLRWIDAVQEQVSGLRTMIEREDAAGLEALVTSLAPERSRWLSGNADESATKTAASMETAGASLGRLFLGGLADRGRKPR